MACHVLVVEDDLDVRESLVEALGDAGYKVLAAVDGVEALEVLRATREVGLVLLDLMMPRKDGWQVVAELESDFELRNVPVCVISAVVDRSPPRAARQLQKPIRLDTLLATVAEFCGPA